MDCGSEPGRIAFRSGLYFVWNWLSYAQAICERPPWLRWMLPGFGGVFAGAIGALVVRVGDGGSKQ